MNAPMELPRNIQNLTMSSNEVAALTEKRHGDVIRDIRVMLEALGDDADLRHVQETKDSRGYTAEFKLPKDLTLTLVAGYNVKLRKRIIDRWLELEAQAAKPIDPMAALSDPATMRGLLLTYTEKVLTLESKVVELAPKAEALDRIADADGLMNPTVAAKSLQVQPKKLFDFMREKHWIYRRPGGSGNVAYQDKIQAGYLTHKITTVQREDGTDKVCEQVLVTAKGLAKLASLLGVQPQMSGAA